MKRYELIAVLLAGASVLGFAENAARVVHYHSNDIVAIRAKMRYTTLVQVPAGEKIMASCTRPSRGFIPT
jgi:type IV secretion system protein VirB9